MTQQTEEKSVFHEMAVATAREQFAPKWEVGKTYRTADRRARVLILATGVKNPKPIVGLLLADCSDDIDEPYTWHTNGQFQREGSISGALDLTTELA